MLGSRLPGFFIWTSLFLNPQCVKTRLALLKLAGPGNRFAVAGEHEAVEFLLRLRQLDDELNLVIRLRHGPADFVLAAILVADEGAGHIVVGVYLQSQNAATPAVVV